jgi:F-type H+-transporting ATPase subunit delta
MSINRIAGRYAKSLLDLAVERNVLDVVKSDIASFSKMAENRDLYLLLKSPIINATKKEQVFNALFGGKFNELTSAFLTLILKKGRESNLPEIAKEFLNQYKSLIGLTTVKVTTATPMDEANLAEIKSRLVASKETAKDVEIIATVDPSIMGGFILQIGDKLYDNSIAYKLSQIKKSVSNKDFIKSI